MWFLILAIACSIGIAALFNLAERRQLDRTALLTVNYAAATVLAVGLQGGAPMSGVTLPLIALGVGQGILFVGGFWLFLAAIRRAGMGLAAGVMRLAVVIPVLASWGIWSEQPSLEQLVGLALGGLAFFLVARPAQREAMQSTEVSTEMGTTLLLGLLFLASGAVDVLNKTFAVEFGGSVSEPTFLVFVFGVAFLTGLALLVTQGWQTGQWPHGPVLGWGVLVGLVNYASADLFLRAVEVLPAPFVFPTYSIAIVFGAALVGFVVWHERVSQTNAIGLAIAMAALVLLSR